MHVDAAEHQQPRQGVPDQGGRERSRSERPPVGVDRRVESGVSGTVQADVHDEGAVGRGDGEAVLAQHRMKGRDMEGLIRSVSNNASLRVGRQEVAVGFPEGIIDLGNHESQCEVGIVAEVERHRIENTPERSELSQELYLAELDIDSISPQPVFELGPHSPLFEPHVIAVVESEEVEAVVREEWNRAGDGGDFIEIEQREPNRNLEVVSDVA